MYLSKFHLPTLKVFRDRQPQHFLREQFWAHALIHASIRLTEATPEGTRSP